MFKCGTVREDGMVFYPYSKYKGVWLTKKEYDKRVEKRRAYQRYCYNSYKSMRKIKRKIGEYCIKRNLYFCGVSASGKEIWRDKTFIDNLKIRQKTYRKLYYQKCKKDPATTLKSGDKHPDNPNLFVLYKRGNRLYFGNAKKLELRKKSLKKIYKKRNEKYKFIRAKKLTQKKYKRGDKNPKNNTFFWYYSKCGNEVWLSPQEFETRHTKNKIKQLNYHRKKRKKTINETN